MLKPLEWVLTDEWQTTREIAEASGWSMGHARYRLHQMVLLNTPVRVERKYNARGRLLWRKREDDNG